MAASDAARRRASARLAAAAKHGNPVVAAAAKIELEQAQRDHVVTSLVDQLAQHASDLTRDQVDRLADVIASAQCAAA